MVDQAEQTDGGDGCLGEPAYARKEDRSNLARPGDDGTYSRADSCQPCGEWPELFSIYVTAPLEQRVLRIMERNRMSQEDARTAVEKVDRQRQMYYEHHTGRPWGGEKDYDLTIDSSVLGVEKTAQKLADMIRRKQQKE